VILTKPIETRIATIKRIARICQYIFFALTAVIGVLEADIIVVLLAYPNLAGTTDSVSFWVTALLYFWAGSLLAFIVLYAYVKTNPPTKPV
jgi:hypothetical protein